jgi:hypothetical protein
VSAKPHLGLLPLAADPGEPEVARVARQVGPRLHQQPRDRPQPLRERLLLGLRQRQPQLPELERALDRAALVGRRVALLGDRVGVEGRVARPGREHAQVEVEAVHLREHELAVDPLGRRECFRVDRVEPRAERVELRSLARERLGRVVRDAVLDRRPLGLAPLAEERDERGPGAGRLCCRGRGRPPGGASDEAGREAASHGASWRASLSRGPRPSDVQ